MQHIRRVKSYSAETGIVYQYVFVARAAVRRGLFRRGAEYLFDVSSDRKHSFRLPVFLPDQAVRDWETRHARVLSDNERYAAAKMRLFRAFDVIEDVAALGRGVDLTATELEELLSALDIS